MQSVIDAGRQSSGEPRLQQGRPSICSGRFQQTSTPERRKSQPNGRSTSTTPDMTIICSRQEFVPGEPTNGSGISYHRKGGIFISRCGAVTLAFLFIALLVTVGLLVFFFAPCLDEEISVVEDDLSWNIGEIHVRNADDQIRLLKTVVPSYYRIRIKPNFTTFTFEGKVTITLSTHKPHVKYITLHSKGLEILNGTTLIEQSVAEPPSFNRSRRYAENDNNNTDLYYRFMQNKDNERNLRKASFGFGNQMLEHNEPSFNLTIGRPTNRNISHAAEKHKHVKIVHVKLNPSLERLLIATEAYLKPYVNYTLNISFKGKIDNSLTGFYYSTYKDLTNDKKETIGVTQFQPTSARKCFPCFDEPNFKAAFELSIASTPNQTVISNMPLDQKEASPEEDLIWYHFQKSLPMSPYMVAFTISDFVSINGEITTDDDGENNNDVPFQIWCRKELLNQTKYGSTIGPKLLKFYEKYFGVQYVLPKLDLIAIPDFAAGAMENWGLITFKETNILIDPDSDSIEAKKSVAMTLAHELAHQWFGNLVTMQWWTDVWLNEGFATYMEYIGLNAVEPSFKMLDEFTLDRMNVMVSDSVESTRPVSSLVNDETQIGQMFDEISYIKSASLLKMLNNVLTKETFKTGIMKYMDEWQFKNAVQDDLWKALNSVLNDSSVFPQTFGIAEFMDSWTLQAGYPVIKVERHYENNTMTVSQNRFCLSSYKNDKELWYVPLTYAVGNTNRSNWNTVPSAWLEKVPSTVLLLPENSNNTWVYFNIMGIGHYRVNYDLHNWKLLQQELYTNPDSFPIESRAQLIDDAFNLARAGRINYSIPFDLTKYLINTELDMIPWYAALENLEYLDLYLQKSKFYYLFQEYISRLITPSLNILGYIPNPEDSPQNVTLRNKLIYWACKIEEEECLAWASRHFANWVNQTNPDRLNPIPFGVRQIVYSTIVRIGSKKEFNFLYERFRNATDPEARTQIIESLPSTRNSWHLHILFEDAITTLDLSLQQNFWMGVKSELASEMAFNFVISEWKKVFAKFEQADDQILQHVITAAFRDIFYEQELRQFKRFIQMNREDLRSVSQLIQKYVERGVLQIQWGKTRVSDIEIWLEEFLQEKNEEAHAHTPEHHAFNAAQSSISSFVDEGFSSSSVLQYQGPYYMG